MKRVDRLVDLPGALELAAAEVKNPSKNLPLALILVELVSGGPGLDGEDPVQLYVATSDAQHRPNLRTRRI